MKHIDFWVLDIEGGELAVLKSLFANEEKVFKVTIDIIVIEFDGGDLDREKHIGLLLAQNEYKSPIRMPDDKQNVWFVHNSFTYRN